MISVESLTKHYGRFTAVDHVSFTAAPGRVTGFLGPNGAGKSTTMRVMVGLTRPTTGRVTVAGRDASAEATRQQVRMALVFQSGALFNSLSVYDNLALYPREHQIADEAAIREKVMRALQILSLEGSAHKAPSELSGGMKKRVAIARGLVMEPQLMLYDEPTSELDPVMAATISEIIATLKDEYRVTSIVVSHDRELALGIADRVGILMGGELVSLGTPADLRTPADPRVAEFLYPKIDLKNPRFKKLET